MGCDRVCVGGAGSCPFRSRRVSQTRRKGPVTITGHGTTRLWGVCGVDLGRFHPHRNLAAGGSIQQAGAAFPGLRVTAAGAILLIFEAPLLRRSACLYDAGAPYLSLL